LSRSAVALLLAPIALLAASCGSSSTTIRIPPARNVFPAPPPGAVVFAREHGDDALALALVPGAHGTLVQASLVGPGGAGVAHATISLRLAGTAGSHVARATGCGPGCYRATLPPVGRPTEATVVFPQAQERFALPKQWPAPDAQALVRRADAAWRRLRTLVFREHLASSPEDAIDSVWRVVAPNRLSYVIRGGASGIVIGNRRWDKLPGGKWQEAGQSPLVQPRPPWTRVANAHIVGSGRVGGVAARLVSFYDPGLPAWFAAWIAAGSQRTLELRMITTAHFMHDVYGPFDGPLSIHPPRRTGG